MYFFHKKNVTKCLGHHYAIWTSDSNFSLAPNKIFGPSFQALLFRLAIALPALLRLMTSDNPFGIYKLFFSVDLYTHNYTIPIIKFISL